MSIAFLVCGGATIEIDDLGAGPQISRIVRGKRKFVFAAAPLFRLNYRPEGGGPIVVLNAGSLAAMPPTPSVAAEGAGLKLVWRIRWPWSGGLIDVVVHIQPRDDMADLRIEVSGNILPYALFQVDFPIIRLPPFLSSEDSPLNSGSFLLLPSFAGFTLPVPTPLLCSLTGDGLTLCKARVLPGPGGLFNMQFVAFYGAADMVYLQTDDSRGYPRDLNLAMVGSDTVLAISNYPVDNDRAGNAPDQERAYESPYSALLTFDRGDWYDAARRYRQWALQQPWAARGPMATAPGYSRRWRETDMWFWPFSTNADLITSDAIRLSEAIGARAVSVLWGGWATPAFSYEIPVWVARPDFREAVKQAQAAGIAVMPYTIAKSWAVTSQIRQRFLALDLERRNIDGTPHIDYQLGDNATYALEIGREEWRVTIIGLWGSFVDTFAPDGLYCDTLSGAAPGLDYNQRLERTGGTDEFKQASVRLDLLYQQRFKGRDGDEFARPDFILLAEQPDEMLIDGYEGVLSQYFYQIANPPLAFSLPLYAAVYHDLQTVNETLPAFAFPEEDGQENTINRVYWALFLHQGRRVGIDNAFEIPLAVGLPLESGPIPRFWEFVRNTMRAADVTRRFLIEGELLRPLPDSVYDLFGRGAIPADFFVLTSVWGAAGDIGVVVTNAGDTTRPVSITLARTRYPIPADAVLVRNDEGYRTVLGRFSDGADITFSFDIAPRAIVLLEAQPFVERPVLVPVPLVIALDGGFGRAWTPSILVPASGAVSLSAVLIQADYTIDTIITAQLETGDDRVNFVNVGDPATSPDGHAINTSVEGVPGKWVRVRYDYEYLGTAPPVVVFTTLAGIVLSAPESAPPNAPGTPLVIAMADDHGREWTASVPVPESRDLSFSAVIELADYDQDTTLTAQVETGDDRVNWGEVGDPVTSADRRTLSGQVSGVPGKWARIRYDAAGPSQPVIATTILGGVVL